MRQIGVGLIGCGYVAEQLHLPALRRVRGANVVALADLDRNRCERLASRFGVARRYGGVTELLDDPAVEVVGILVPPAGHAELLLDAVEARKHALVEKPLGLTLDECDRMIEAVSRSDVKAGVAFNLRAHRLVDQARQLLSDGLAGTIQAISSVITGTVGAGAADRHGWRSDARSGGGALFEKGAHHYDLWRLMSGSEVVEVKAIAERDEREGETAAVSARLDGGALASGAFADSPAAVNAISITGTGGSLNVSLLEYDGLTYIPAGRHPGDVRVRLRRFRDSVSGLPAGLSALRAGGEYATSFARQWHRFLEAVRGYGPVDCSLEDGRRALEIALATVESSTVREPVRVSEASKELTIALGNSA